MDWQHLISVPGYFAMFVLGISVLAGLVGSILGLGGGLIVVPALTLLAGVNIRYAIGASLVSVIATSSGSAAAYVRDRLTNVRVAILLEVATVLGALSGVWLSTRIETRLLFFIFAAVMLYSTIIMIRNRKRELFVTGLPDTSDRLATRLKLHSSYPDKILKQDVAYGVSRVRLGFAMMFGAGAVSGLLGIGSGALKVPAMDGVMKLPIRVSSATSNFMMGVTAAASAGAYYMRGDILPTLAAPVAIGVFVGAWFGTRLMVRLPSARIRYLFVVFLILISIQMVIKGLGGA